MTLNHFFTNYSKVAVAFSGGVDSSYLLYAAKKYAKKVQAYYVNSAFQPEFELEDAKKLAHQLQVDMKVLSVDVLGNRQVKENPHNRCYYCKRQIFSTILSQAKEDGFSVILDGTNASDLADDRPGMKALGELSVLSPLRMCQITKPEVRRLSKEVGLFTWNKPAYACLATRIPTGQPIAERLLQRTERAEGYLASLGFSDFRIRTKGESAAIQVTEKQLPLLMQNRQTIIDNLRKEYESVFLDLEVRNES